MRRLRARADGSVSRTSNEVSPTVGSSFPMTSSVAVSRTGGRVEQGLGLAGELEVLTGHDHDRRDRRADPEPREPPGAVVTDLRRPLTNTTGEDEGVDHRERPPSL